MGIFEWVNNTAIKPVVEGAVIFYHYVIEPIPHVAVSAWRSRPVRYFVIAVIFIAAIIWWLLTFGEWPKWGK